MVPLSVNESSRFEIHNRTVVRGSRSKRSSRKFDPFFGLFPAVGATERSVAPSSAWHRLPVVVVVKGGVDLPIVNEGDDLSADNIELPKSNRNRKRKAAAAAVAAPLSITADEDRWTAAFNGENARDGNLIDRSRVAGEQKETSLEAAVVGGDGENALGSPLPSNRDRVEEVGNVPKIEHNVFGGGGGGDDATKVDSVVDQKTVTADHGNVDDVLGKPQEEDGGGNDRAKRKTEIYSREEVSYVFVPGCVEQPKTRLVPPFKYQIPGGFHHSGHGNRRPHIQDYRDPRNRHRPQDYGRYSMYHWWQCPF